MRKAFREHEVLTGAAVVSILALGLYLPFLAIQYDTNGIAEAAALDAGQLFNKNHLLYRPVGWIVHRFLQHFGYSGTSLSVLQVINAFCGAAGAGLAYALFRKSTSTAAAAAGSCLFATSYMYWLFSTDVAYLPLAAMLVSAAAVCIVFSRSRWGIVSASVLISLAILTWQANLFAVPALMVMLIAVGTGPVRSRAAAFALAAAGITGCAYVAVAFASRGVMGPRAFWAWFTTYSETGTLPLWGVWDAGRIGIALTSAVGSIVPFALAVSPGEITRSTQLGRIAVDIALLALAFVVLLAAIRIRKRSMLFLFGYISFFPFIVWWDPFQPGWFIIPNIFLAGFVGCGLQAWLDRKLIAAMAAASLLAIAGANFVTTIRPRHNQLGPDRTMAQCVAGHMREHDVFIAAEWGWPDYLEYVHGKTALNLINETAYAHTKEQMLPAVKGFMASRAQEGGTVYMADPASHSEAHLAWLKDQTGLTIDDLHAFGGLPAFSCSGRTINRLP